MQRQAVPLISTEAPVVGTGMESKAARRLWSLSSQQESGVVEILQVQKS